MQIKENLKKFWKFLKADTWQSWIVSMIILIILIKFILFPVASAITGTQLPLVIVESCSMYHSLDFNNWWDANGGWYEAHNITKAEFQQFSLSNGLNKGDILLVMGNSKPKIGDIIIFNAGSKYPLIHRLVSQDPLATKGDHNSEQLKSGNNALGIDETKINSKDLLGQAKFKVIPLLGWIKLIWFEPFKTPSERGLCH